MSEERISNSEEMESDDSVLLSEDLEKIAGGLAEEEYKVSNREQSRKTNT